MLRYTLTSSRRHPTAIALCQAGADSIIGERWKSTQEQQVDNEDEPSTKEDATPINKNDWRSRLSKMGPSSSSTHASSARPATQYRPPSWKQQRSEPSSNNNNNKNNNNKNRNNKGSQDDQLEQQRKRDPLMKFFQDRKQQSSQDKPSTTTTTSSISSTSSWRQRVQGLSKSNLQQKAPPSISSQPAWRSKRSDADPQTPITDMRDVSALRAAFLKSTHASKRAQKEQVQQIPGNSDNNNSNNSSWRGNNNSRNNNNMMGGAREYRKRVQHQQWQERQQQQHRRNTNPYQKWVKLDAAAFYGTKDDMDRKKANDKSKRSKRRQVVKQADDFQVLLPPAPVSITALSGIFRVKIDNIHKRLKELGERAARNNDDFLVDVDTMEVMALDLGLEPIRSNRRVVASFDAEQRELLLSKRGDDATEEAVVALLPPRPPVVCIMGHVDHGKTTLMDALRRKSSKSGGDGADSGGKKKKKKMKNKGNSDNSGKKGSDVAGTEAGGITQVISAFQVALEGAEDYNGAVTFLDTPGHAAFRSMREAGSHAADVIVLVIAADDGVSPQTIEILNFYKSIVSESGGITLVVAMTKVDKPGINVDESRYRIESELMEQGIVTESYAANTESEYGPPVQLVPVSGLTGDGLDDLIESLVLQSEVMELRADPNASAEGIVMDARMEKGVGVVADCIVRWGSLERGDIVLSGVHSGKVKALKDASGAILKKASPSQPVRIIGFKTLPKAGDPITCVESEEKADQLIERRIAMGGKEQSHRSEDEGPATLEVMGVAAQHVNLQRIHAKYDMQIGATANTIRIPIIIKADADGTLAALRDSMVAIGEDSSLDIIIDPIGQGIGPINASDVEMASLSNAAIFSFNVKQNDREALEMIDSAGVQVKNNNVIYSLLDDAKEIFANYLPSVRTEHLHGKAIVQAIFEINNSSEREKIAGLRVTSGSLHREKTSIKGSVKPVACHYRVMRNGEQVSPAGEVVSASSLKRVKQDVQEIKNGDECGLGLDGFNNIQQGDVIECYSVQETKVMI